MDQRCIISTRRQHTWGRCMSLHVGVSCRCSKPTLCIYVHIKIPNKKRCVSDLDYSTSTTHTHSAWLGSSLNVWSYNWLNGSIYKLNFLTCRFSISSSHYPKMSPATEFSERQHPDTIVLFDVDGTLTPARAVSIHGPWTLRVCLSLWHCPCSLFPRRWRRLWPTFARRPLLALLVVQILASNMNSLVNPVSSMVMSRCMTRDD